MYAYSLEFKKAAVEKYFNRGNKAVSEIINEIGISESAIYRWKAEFTKIGVMKKQTKPQSRTADEKIKALIEYETSPAERRGEYLRQNGLYETIIIEWRNQIKLALSTNGDQLESKERKELLAEKKRNQQLEKELDRKNKALAEASALLILKKKADLIWGLAEEEE